MHNDRKSVPTFTQPLHVGEPWSRSYERFTELLEEIFARKYFTNHGKMVNAFEERIADLHDVRHCVSVASGTLAIQIALKALGVSKEVIMPSFTFIGTAHAAEWIGVRPVFCDIDPVRLTLSPQAVAESITAQTECIVPVNIFGRPADFTAIQEVAQRHGIPVLYDSAHCIGGAYEGRPIGGQGDAQILSFHATKSVHTFEGGAVLTNDDALAAAMRRLRNYGYENCKVVSSGINAKMSEVCAAHGLACLEDLAEIMQFSQENVESYRNAIDPIPGVTILPDIVGHANNYHYVCFMVNEAEFGTSRDALWQALQAENILARRYFYPGCHRMSPYDTVKQPSLPVTESAVDNILCLPNGESVTSDVIRQIVECIASVGRAGRVTDAEPLAVESSRTEVCKI